MRIHHRNLRGSGGSGGGAISAHRILEGDGGDHDPEGIPVCVSLEEKTSGDSWAECAVRKDAGDDYDVTNGILVYARAEFVKDKNFYEKVQMSHLESSGFGAAGEKPGLSPENQKQAEKSECRSSERGTS